MNKVSSRWNLLGIGCLAILAAVVCVFAHREPRFPGDLRVTLWFQSVDSEGLASFLEFVSHLGGEWPALVLAIVCAIVMWRWLGRLEMSMVLLTALSPLLYSVLKLVVDRPRPSPDLVQVFVAETGGSFPSGHAFFAMVFLGLLGCFALTRLRKTSLRMLTVAGCAVLILFVGASRVYLGVHWLSDVLGGYLCGGVFLAILVWLYVRFRRQRGIAS